MPPQVLVGTGIVVVALIVSSSGAVARTQFVDWQGWDLSTKPGKRVGVEYVWRSNYDGIRWPRKRTRVFTVRAPSNSSYWRATTLDAFRHDGWDEDLVPAFAITSGNRVDLTEDPFVPAPGRDPAHWTAARVTIDALRDAHLVGPSQPVAYEAVTVRDVQYEESGIALALAPVSRGDHYTVWGYTPRPKPAQLAKSPPDYPPQIADDREFLVLDGAAVPPFGTPEHAAWISDYLRSSAEADRYRLLYRAAERIAGRADNPYAAAVALEAWFRSSGGFTYDEHPPHARGVPPLVDFVARTKRGYCQHFAGAMAVMLRYLGIPARVAAGFTSGNYDADRGVWNVTDRNAHTWVEVWFKGYGWLPFDPTPGRGTLAGSYTSASVSFDARGALAVLGASALAGRTLLRFELGPPGRDRQSRLRRGDAATPDRGAGGPAQSGRHVGTGGILALAALGLLGLFVLAKLALRRSRYLTKDPRLIAAACRRELVEYLLDQGVEVPRSAGPRELGRLLTTRIGPGATAFAEALGAARYGPLPSAETAARDARRELRRVRGKLRRSFAFGRRVRGLLSPRSLVGVR